MTKALEDMGEKELYEKIEEANLVERLESDPAFRLLRVAADRIVNKAVIELTKTPPTDLAAIVQLQTIIKKYKWNLFAEINLIKEESKLVYAEAKERGMFGNFFDGVKKAVGIE